MNARDTAGDFEAEGFALSVAPAESRLQIWVSALVAAGIALAAIIAMAPVLSGTA